MSNLYQINRATRDAVILNLRRVFSGHSKYPYVETISGEYDWDSTKVIISDAIPQDHAFFPAIIVDTVSGPETRYLGPDDLRDTLDSNDNTAQTDELFASLDLTVNIKIFTIDDTIARDELLDVIYDHFKLITDDLADAGIEIKRTTFQPDTRSFQDNRWYVTPTLSLQVYKEWVDDLGAGTLVSDIEIDLQLLP